MKSWKMPCSELNSTLISSNFGAEQNDTFMKIEAGALLNRGFRISDQDEDGVYYERYNGTWGIKIRVCLFFNESILVQIGQNYSLIDCFGCKTMGEVDQLIDLFL